MEKLKLEPTLNTPRILLDPEQRTCSFSGESRPENVRNFYMPVLEWLKEYAASFSSGEKNGKLDVEVKFDYFNSTSAKYILDVFKIFRAIQDKGVAVAVSWSYESDDEDMYEVGTEMARMSGIKFKFIEEEI